MAGYFPERRHACWQFHLQTYGETTVNYNRDIEIFPVLKRMLERILGESPYASPTDMGVNMVGFAITDDEAAIEASKQEIIRRYYQTVLDFKSRKKLAKLLSRKLSCS